jgi:PBP1b-binding outer membrane lipoprotein LpoB
MKKQIAVFAVAALCVALLAGCGSAASSQNASPAADATAAPAASDSVSDATADSAASGASDSAVDTTKLNDIVSALEAVNPVSPARAFDDLSVSSELMLTADNLAAYKGDIANTDQDCAVVFVAQAKDGKADAVKSELEAYAKSLTENDLYGGDHPEITDKIKDARVVANGNYVALVIAGVNGPAYADIDTAITSALG